MNIVPIEPYKCVQMFNFYLPFTESSLRRFPKLLKKAFRLG